MTVPARETGGEVREMVDIRKQFGGEARDSRFSGMPKLFATFSSMRYPRTREKLVAKFRTFARAHLWSKGLLACATSEFFYADVSNLSMTR